MNFDLTRSNLFATTLYSLVLVAVFWSTASITHSSSIYVGVPTDELYLVSRWIEQFVVCNPLVARVLSALLVFWCSLMVARLALRNVIFLERSYMPSMLYVIISSAFYNSGESLLPLMVAVFLIMAYAIFFRSYAVRGVASGRYLSAGTYFGLASMVYPSALYLLPILITALAVFRLGSIKEWIAALVGVALPLGMVFYGLWIVDADTHGEFTRYVGELTLHDNISAIIARFNVIDYTFIATIFTLIVFSYVAFCRSVKNYKIHSRLAYNFIFASMWWTIVVMLVSPVRSLYLLPVVAVGASVLIPAYFASRRPTFWSNFLYAILILSSVAMHIVRF